MTFPTPTDWTVGAAFGHTAAEDVTALTYEQLSPDPDDNTKPGPVRGPVVITEGRIGNAPTASPTTITCELADPTGEFSDANVAGSRYSTLLRDTPVEVRIGGTLLARAAQPSWTSQWDGTRADGGIINGRVPINAIGSLARLDVEDISALALAGRYGFIDGDGTIYAPPVGWWPMEIGADTNLLEIPGGTTAPAREIVTDTTIGDAFQVARTSPSLTATPAAPGATTGPVGSASALDLTGGVVLSGALPEVDFGGIVITSRRFDIAVKLNGTVSSTVQLFRLSSPSASFAVEHTTSGLRVSAVQAGTTDNTSVTTTTRLDDDGWHWISLRLEVPTLVNATLTVDNNEVASGLLNAAITGTAVTDLRINSGAALAAVCHGMWWLGVNTSTSIMDVIGYPAMGGHTGETTATRLTRLLWQLSIPAHIETGDTALLGPQRTQSPVATAREAEATDEGMLVNLPDGRAGYLPRVYLTNQTAALELTFSPHVTDLIPGDPDRDLWNAVTLTTPVGTYTAVEMDGPYGQNKIGPRPIGTVAARNPYTLAQLADNAGWLLARGTTGQRSYVVVLDFRANPGLIDDYLASGLGARITITGAPASQVGPYPLDLMVVGRVTTFDGGALWRVALHCEPYAPYIAAVWADDDATADDDPSRYDTNGCRLEEGLFAGTAGYASTPDAAAFDLTAPFTLAWYGFIADLDSGSAQTLVAKWGAAGQRSYGLRVTADGYLEFFWTSDGTTEQTVTSTDPISDVLDDGQAGVLVAIVGDPAGTVALWAGATDTYTDADEFLGSDTATVTPFASTADVTVGALGDGTDPLVGVTYGARVTDGSTAGLIAAVADPVFTGHGPGTTSFVDGKGLTWTAGGTGGIYAPPADDLDSVDVLLFTTTGPRWIDDATYPDEFPFELACAGEIWDVSAIAGTDTVQVATIDRTVAKQHTAGTDVALAHPARYGM